MLNLGGYDLSNFVSSFGFDVEVSYEYTELVNGRIAKSLDLGSAADHFYCTLDLIIPFSENATFISWYNSNKGVGLSVTTDLDIFFPNVYTYSANKTIPYNLTFIGPLEYNFSKHLRYELKLYYGETPTYTPTLTQPACLFKAIWLNDYQYSDNFRVINTGFKSEFIKHENNVNIWNMDLSFLTKNNAHLLLAWILTVRTDTFTRATNDLNSNGEVGKVASYKIKSFTIQNQNTYYAASIELVQMS